MLVKLSLKKETRKKETLEMANLKRRLTTHDEKPIKRARRARAGSARCDVVGVVVVGVGVVCETSQRKSHIAAPLLVAPELKGLARLS